LYPVSPGVLRMPGGYGKGTKRDRKEGTVGTDDKLRNKAEELKGKAKEKVGEATDNEQWEAEGKADQAKGNLKQAGEKVKDVFK
jgi:uncharacterized protein YjbJ (UPF0337 family)